MVWGAHNLVHQLGLPLKVTERLHAANYNRFPSWFFTKPLDGVVPKLVHNPELVRLGEMEKQHKQALAKEARIRKRREKEARA